MSKDIKIEAFEYLLSRLIDWKNQYSNNNDLGILKVLKLTFFVSAAGTDQNSKETLLDDIFNNFVAMPYGHVESDVYKYIKNGLLSNVSINNNTSKLSESFNILNYDSNVRNKIDKSVQLLKEINPELINLSSFDLVDLSHSWYSWQKYFNEAKSKGKLSTVIPVDEIKKEDKIYQI
ncbi:type II toxin-antitoxin system antitoxin SocA domain-containing protein [Flavobacterium sp. KACC 22763]|uniref:type II toxin-antitoxin system antitoxin SocA domain-containing protein n=1 Tax=Flavobacterium sp. KACC 22763 TaxID=3025668 RepID=UPI00236547BC|nr:type II toxin-antitoxin system antitoxin SocA domain-containing protein [Flavobacterium sp. KACC 22763]WDF63176.1 DUF4065 domain-containing protein [Flavobacterium sp. KACC 22763]